MAKVFPTLERLVLPAYKGYVFDYIQRYLKGEFDLYEAQFRMLHKDGTIRWIPARGAALRNADGTPYRMAGSHTDVTERRRTEIFRELAAEMLGILNQSEDLGQSLPSVLAALRKATGCEAAGIRLKSHGDFPYFRHDGFSQDFILAENSLLARDARGDVCRNPDGSPCLECTCGLVLSGNTDPSNPLFTPAGSAWTNDSHPLLHLPESDDPRRAPRNRCIHEGFSSIALVPIRAKGEIIGLLQLNGHAKGLFDLPTIQALENVASHVGEALLRQQTAAALRDSEAKFRMLTESMRDVVWILDADERRYLYVSPSVATLRGFSPEEVLAAPFEDSLTKESLEHVVPLGLRRREEFLQNKGTAERFYVDLLEQPCKTGGTVWTEVISRFRLNQETGHVEIHGVTRDITERRLNEANLRESEERFRHLYQTMGQGVVYQDADGRVVDANPAALRILGLTLDQMQGRTSFDPRWRAVREDGSPLPGDDHPAMVALRTGQPVRGVLMGVFHPGDNEQKWILVDATPRCVPGELRPNSVFATFTDLTLRRRITNELKAAKEMADKLNQELKAKSDQLQSIIEALPGGLKVVDADLRIVMANANALKKLPESVNSVAQILGRKCHEIFMGRQDACDWCGVVDAIADGKPVVETTTPEDPREQRLGYPLQINVAPMFDERGRVVGAVEYEADVSTLRRAIEQADAANRAKDDFLANVSHEIRTPMNAIMGLSNQLAHSPLDPGQNETLGKIRSASRMLMRLLNDLLDYSKAAADELELECQPFAVAELLGQMDALFASLAREKRLKLKLAADGNVPPALVGDSLRLAQILTNLLSNAIKFTERGEVRLEISAKEQSEDRATLRFCISDTGIGIVPEVLPRLFQPFFQADASTTRLYGGTGLGLSISQRLVQRMGGRIEVSSAPGQGSQFRFELAFPVAATDAIDGQNHASSHLAPHAAPVDVPDLGGASILLVEDNPLNQEVAHWWLERTGARVQMAGDGLAALDLAARHPFDLVLMDLQMPLMDGFEAATRLRAAHPNLPIVALSAASGDRDKAQAADAGIVDYLSKPIDERNLYAVLRKWLNSSGTASTRPSGDRDSVRLPAALDGFDLRQGLRSSGGDSAFYLRMLHRLDAQLANSFAQLPQLLDSGDLAAAARMAHSLKGSADTVGAVRLAAAARAIERAAKNDTAPSTELRGELVRAMQDARRQIAALPPPPPTAAAAEPQADADAFERLASMLAEQRWIDESLLASALRHVDSRLGGGASAKLAACIESFALDDALSNHRAVAAPLAQNPPEPM